MGKDFGSLIKIKRLEKSLSLKKLCLQVKREDGQPISVSYLNDIEQGRRNPPEGLIVVQIAEALGLDKDELLKLAGKPAPDLEKAIRNPKMAALFRIVHDDPEKFQKLLNEKEKKK